MATGTVKWFNATKGFGFIQPDAGGRTFSSISAPANGQILSGQFEAGLKLPVTYHVVIAFDRDAEGDLKPGEAREVMSPIVAERRARALALEHAGSLSFSRTGYPATA